MGLMWKLGKRLQLRIMGKLYLSREFFPQKSETSILLTKTKVLQFLLAADSY